MGNRVFAASCCVGLLVMAVYGLAATSPSMTTTITTPSVTSGRLPAAGYVSLDRIVTFEDVKQLSIPMSSATSLLRSGKYSEALAAFQAVERATPTEALAYRGENESARSLNALDAAVLRHQQQLSVAEARKDASSSNYLAALHYALGDALMMKKYQMPLGEAPQDLGPEPKQHFLKAIRLNPRLLEAHLAMASYYEHRSQLQGTAARREYITCLRLRPDLYQIGFLHASSWDRPGFLGNAAHLQAQGFQISDDERSLPQRAINECLALVRDHPQYAPPYYQLGSDYADFRYPTHNAAAARHYLAVYVKIGDPFSAWGQYAMAEIQTLDREATSKTKPLRNRFP